VKQKGYISPSLYVCFSVGLSVYSSTVSLCVSPSLKADPGIKYEESKAGRLFVRLKFTQINPVV
jgi:hypothetical protein